MIDQCAGCRIGCSWDCVILVIHNVIFAVENQIIMQCLGLVKIAHARGHIVLDDLLDETVEFGVFFSSFLNFCGTVLIVYLYPGWRTILFSTGTDACNIILVLVGPTVIQAVQYFSELLAVYTEGRNINFRFYILESINNRCFQIVQFGAGKHLGIRRPFFVPLEKCDDLGACAAFSRRKAVVRCTGRNFLLSCPVNRIIVV